MSNNYLDGFQLGVYGILLQDVNYLGRQGLILFTNHLALPSSADSHPRGWGRGAGVGRSVHWGGGGREWGGGSVCVCVGGGGEASAPVLPSNNRPPILCLREQQIKPQTPCTCSAVNIYRCCFFQFI